jgi:hypothetical protein
VEILLSILLNDVPRYLRLEIRWRSARTRLRIVSRRREDGIGTVRSEEGKRDSLAQVVSETRFEIGDVIDSGLVGKEHELTINVTGKKP